MTLRGHVQAVQCLALSTDRKCLFSSSRDGTIKVWDLTVGKECLALEEQVGVDSLALSAAGKRLFSGDSLGAIKVWNLEPE